MIPEAIRNPCGERLALAFTPGAPERRDLFVLGHGVTSDKDRPWSEGIAAALESAGVASLRIAFSGNGASEGKFVDSTITKEALDLGSVLDAFPEWRIGYVGHSMGGAVGLLRASEDRRIKSLVSLAAVTHTAEFVQRMFGHLTHGDFMLEKPHCPYGPALESDLMALGSLADKAESIRVPWLIVHGSDDDVVPPQHSRDLHAAAPTRSELVELAGVDHSFTGVGLPRMIELVVPWLLRHALA